MKIKVELNRNMSIHRSAIATLCVHMMPLALREHTLKKSFFFSGRTKVWVPPPQTLVVQNQKSFKKFYRLEMKCSRMDNKLIKNLSQN